jgi:uracil-DNA glycosylase
VFPPPASLFAALNATPLASVRVVVLGQDPYHDAGQAMGLSFSVPPGVRVPSSLVNIFKELAADVGAARPAQGDLSRWAAQGVLLLNAALSVRAHAPGSHAKRGWEAFTDGVVRALLAARRRAADDAAAAAAAAASGRAIAAPPPPPPPLVFLLWGKHAQEKGQGVLRAAGGARLCTVLEAPHPSGLSAHRGFFGCRHFSKANAALVAAGGEPIDWQIV